MNLFHSFDIAHLMTTLRTGDDGQVLLLGFLVGVEDLANARAINADRLLGKDVFAGGHCGLQVNRPEPGRRG